MRQAAWRRGAETSWLDRGKEVWLHECQCKRARRSGKAKRDRRTDAPMVGSKPPGPCLEGGAWGNADSLPGLAVRGPAAADDGSGGDALLSGVSGEMAAGGGSRSRFDRGCDQRFR